MRATALFPCRPIARFGPAFYRRSSSSTLRHSFRSRSTTFYTFVLACVLCIIVWKIRRLLVDYSLFLLVIIILFVILLLCFVYRVFRGIVRRPAIFLACFLCCATAREIPDVSPRGRGHVPHLQPLVSFPSEEGKKIAEAVPVGVKKDFARVSANS